MRTSRNGIDLIKRFEGFESKAYKCPAGVMTIGYGHTKGVKVGDTCTQAQGEEFLKQDLATAESAVNTLKVNQNQFDALVSFTYNVGVSAFKNSTLYKKVKANPLDETIANEFAKWRNAGGVVLQGLVKRRAAEAELYNR